MSAIVGMVFGYPGRVSAGMIVASGLVLGGVLHAETLIVAADGSGPYATIVDAVGAAATGDEVVLLDGVYYGEGNRDVLCQGKSIVIRSESGDAASCVVDCEGSVSEEHYGFGFVDTGPTTELDALTIRGACMAGGGAVLYGGIASGAVRNCILTDNSTEEYGAAIYSVADGVIVVENCTIARNRSPGAAVVVEDLAQIEMRHCIIAYTQEGGSVSCWPGASDIECCDFYGNEGGDWSHYCVSSYQGVSGNISEDPLFCGWEEGNYYLQSDSPCAPGGECGLIGALPVGCEPSPIMESTWGEIKALYRHPATE